MKYIVAGGRDFDDYDRLEEVVKRLTRPSDTIISGRAKGADSLGEKFAEAHHVEVELFPADWDTHKKAAGVLRNRTMAEHADALIAFWDGGSKGTKNMIDTALRLGLEVHVYPYN